MTKTGVASSFAAAVAFLAWGCSEPEQPIPLKPKPKAEVSSVTPANTSPAPAPKAEAPKPDPNKELAQRVKRALESDAKIPAGGIDVTADDGRVTLWGTTGTAGERSRAAQAAAKVDGVKGVDNQLKVVKGS